MSMVTRSNPASSIQETVQELKDEVVRELWKKGGRACVADLANELDPPKSAKELSPIVESLEREGIVRRVSSWDYARDYESPYEVIYELSR